MKLKVKLFLSKTERRLDDPINEFIESCGKIKIIDIKFATCEALIIYEMD